MVTNSMATIMSFLARNRKRYSYTLGTITLIVLLLRHAIRTVASKAAGFTHFPQSLRSSISQYFRSFGPPLESQHRLLQPILSHCEGLTFESRQVVLARNKVTINELIVSNCASTTQATTDLVYLHGYGSGLGFWSANFSWLSSFDRPVRIHAIDWPGMGFSSRSRFDVPRNLSLQQQRIWVEDYFVNHLHDYLKQKGLQKVMLVAHSFGAYLAIQYVHRYPRTVTALMLISPVAVNVNPYETIHPSQCCTQCDEVVVNNEAVRRPANPLPRMIVWLWEAGYTPFDFLRRAIFLGPKFLSAWTYTLDLALITSPNMQGWLRNALHDYTYRIFTQPASSERALQHILAAGAHAHAPIIHRIPRDIPVTLVYGEHDWMSVSAGLEACEHCNAHGGQSSLKTIPGTGHHSYLERPAEVNAEIAKLVRDHGVSTDRS